MLSVRHAVQEAAHEEALRQEQLEHAKQAGKMRQEVENGAQQLAEKYDRSVTFIISVIGWQSFDASFLFPSLGLALLRGHRSPLLDFGCFKRCHDITFRFVSTGNRPSKCDADRWLKQRRMYDARLGQSLDRLPSQHCRSQYAIPGIDDLHVLAVDVAEDSGRTRSRPQFE